MIKKALLIDCFDAHSLQACCVDFVNGSCCDRNVIMSYNFGEFEVTLKLLKFHKKFTKAIDYLCS